MPKEETAKTALQPGRAPDLKPRTYSDGHPLDDVQYLECKLILKPDRFTSAKVFQDYSELVARTAKQFDIGFSTKGVVLKPEIREVLFLDTADFRLYNNAFILRRRIAYENGFPVSDPEMVFKFRHPDLQKAAELDIRPKIAGDYRIKFKAEALPLKDQLGGYRLLYSHNVELSLSQVPDLDHTSLPMLGEFFPCLASLRKSKNEKVEYVNHTIVEEVLQDLGELDFGKGVTAKSNLALWRERGMHRPLCGEFAFQCKFKRRDELHEKAMERGKQFFIALQQAGHEWLSLGTTKTGLVYRLKGNPPQAHE
ncbi:MAG TPA: hypothetical protein VMH32_18685 [Burkholderiales bacterium]|nr:hypothetical protein [Burkholderiales bacterium]